MATITIRPGELGARIKADGQKFTKAIEKGLKKAAQRGKKDLIKASPVYTGLFRHSWEVRVEGEDVILENTSPYAGIIERGARPHKVNQEGVEAIKRWIYLKLGLDFDSEDVYEADEANSILWGFIKRLEKYGQPGLFIVKNAVPDLTKYAQEEVIKAIGNSLNKP